MGRQNADLEEKHDPVRDTKTGRAETRKWRLTAKGRLEKGEEMVLAKTWAMGVAKRSGMKAACVALARRLSVIMHRMWRDGTDFIWSKGELPSPDSIPA